MKVKGHWEFAGVQIPGFWYDDKTSPDGKRFVCTKYGWGKLRSVKCRAADQKCQLRLPGCPINVPFDVGDLHHTGKHGRGIGGLWRDDRETVWIDRKNCHPKAEKERTGSRWSKCENLDGSTETKAPLSRDSGN